MSRQSATDFLERLRTDEDFATKAKKRLDSAEPGEHPDAIRDLGYDVSDEDLRTALAQAGSTDAERLDEEELEGVTGGTSLTRGSYELKGAGGTTIDLAFPDERWSTSDSEQIGGAGGGLFS